MRGPVIAPTMGPFKYLGRVKHERPEHRVSEAASLNGLLSRTAFGPQIVEKLLS